MKCDFCKIKNSSSVYSLITNSTNKKRTMCSELCLDKYKSKYHIGSKKSEYTKNKIANSNSKPQTDERKLNISIARRKKNDLKSHILPEIDSYLKYPYYSLMFISKHLNVNYDRLVDYSKNHTDSNIIKSNCIRIKGKHYKNLIFSDKIVLDWFLNNIENYTKDEIKNELKVRFNLNGGFKSISSNSVMLKLFGKTYKPCAYTSRFGKSFPEKLFEQFLIENNIEYEYNKMIKVSNNGKGYIYYSVDFVLFNNIFVEIQGDYWHGNPIIYKFENLSGIQRNHQNRDRRKKAQLIQQKNPTKYYQIWEYDIKNDTKIYNNYKTEILCIVQNSNVK